MRLRQTLPSASPGDDETRAVIEYLQAVLDLLAWAPDRPLAVGEVVPRRSDARRTTARPDQDSQGPAHES